MRRISLLAMCISLCGLFIVAAILAVPFNSGKPGPASVRARGLKAPIVFEHNVGQANPEVQFVARGSGFTLGVKGDETLLVLSAPPVSPKPKGRGTFHAPHPATHG